MDRKEEELKEVNWICLGQCRATWRDFLNMLKNNNNNKIRRLQLTNSMEQGFSWKATRSSSSQDIVRILWNPNFITAFTTARHQLLSWARLIKSMPHLTSQRSTLILFLYLRLGLPSSSFPQVSPLKLFTHSFLLHTCYMSCHLSFLDLISRVIFG